MISIEQCRGARGILGWTQQNLADASGLSKTAINNFEKGHSDIKAESLRAIRMAFESAEMEFLGQNGIRKKTEDVRILHGPESMSILLEDIQSTMAARNGEILIMNANNNLSSQVPTQKLFDHIDLIKTNNIRQRILCPEGTKNILSPNDECRWIPADISQRCILTFIYTGKVAFQLWDQSIIIIIDSNIAYESEKKRFEHIWANAMLPTEQKSNTSKQVQT
ncbi:MAG: helix-turn-helix transcriptional regulator [Rhodospirillales bacterium]|nr:helix-turn-helix transcriptional regulator [Alphaproteobacteria bacterium]MCB1720771.1 helix-turn-helix transcriptional regulator [Alphaproteobacteria bacterium]MCB9981152.1 helix-turn-helix transcriptional regulator [Rhodospirillales bacterium]